MARLKPLTDLANENEGTVICLQFSGMDGFAIGIINHKNYSGDEAHKTLQTIELSSTTHSYKQITPAGKLDVLQKIYSSEEVCLPIKGYKVLRGTKSWLPYYWIQHNLPHSQSSQPQ